MDYRTASMLPPPGLPPQPSPGQTFDAGADRGRALRRARWLRRLELAALGYIVCISAGVFGFIDILVLGSAYSKTSESLFAQLLWPAAYLLFAGLILWRWRELLAAARRCWWVLPFPALAGLSVLWSMDAEATTGAAVRMAATTVIGLYIGTRFLPAVTAKAVFAVLLAAVGASVLTGAASLEFAMDGPVVRGLFHHKNTLGSRAALLAVVSLALALSGWRPALAVAGAVLGAMATVLSSSAAGLALGVIALLAAPFALSLRGGSLVLGLRVALVGILTVVVLFVLTLWRIDPIAGALVALDRDATLTGRVDLWQVAIAQIAQRPLLGAGFDAFWNAGLDWQALALLERLGAVLHFHNTFLEIAVQLGAVGLVAALPMLAAYLRAALQALRTRVDAVPLWPSLFGVMALALALVENELFVKHNLMHILFVAIPVAVSIQTGRYRAAADPRREPWRSGAPAVEAHQA